MYEKLDECPSCKHPQFANYKICKDHSVSGESFALVICQNCKLIFTTPRPSESHIHAYYQSENYISHTNKANNLTNLIYKQVRNITLRQKVALIKRYTTGKHLLDYGCGTGTFLDYCQSKRYMVDGFEPNPKASAIASDQLGKQVATNTAQLQGKATYDVITAWHVIEHVHHLMDTITSLRKLLKPKGVLFIAVPNINSYDAKHYDANWAAYDVPRHLYHFNKKSFTHFAKQAKLHIQHIHPMKFDAYYVSLLSEKYRNSNSQFLNAFKTGYKSNKLARKTGEYSSLIYVLTK